jgi:leader peptidase (prepilin peptidase)/N-methyltransferase
VTLLHLYELLGLLIGLLFGSFLNVCIARLPKHESIVKPGSHCMACGHAVRWYDNVPVLSWLLLRARCRDCKARISWRYPAVELAVGAWFAIFISDAYEGVTHTWTTNDTLVTWFAGHLIALVLSLILGFLLIGLMVMDWQTQRLPDAFTLTGIGIGMVLVCVRAFFLTPGESTWAFILWRVIAIAGAALILLTVRWGYKALRKRDGMGLGDVKLLAMIAAFLGFGQTLFALFAGVVAASIYGILLMARHRASGASSLPLGSFLAAGGLFSALFGPQILAWYMGMLR